jgi:hypothetical protein
LMVFISSLSKHNRILSLSACANRTCRTAMNPSRKIKFLGIPFPTCLHYFIFVCDHVSTQFVHLQSSLQNFFTPLVVIIYKLLVQSKFIFSSSVSASTVFHIQIN